MCGFAGFVGSSDPALLQRMGFSIEHRGPDGKKDYADQCCSFIHSRLSIIDLSTAGAQPMKTENGRFVIAYNGEIYNYHELRKRYELEGWTFKTQTDTECFLASAELHGLRDLDRFHGMFAFAVWDTQEHVCHIARDRMGIKPLFISVQNERIVFASEIQALLSLQDKWKIDPVARSMYVTVGYVPGPRTMYQGIQSLIPGRRFEVRDGILKDEGQYYTDAQRTLLRSRSEAKDKLIQCVDSAVASQLVSDRPIGVFLSGGLDSSVVLSSMRLAQPSGRIKTFTTRFEHHSGDAKYNRDADIARKTAIRFGCEPHEICVGEKDVMEQAEAIARTLGQPHSNHSTVALDAVAKLAKKDVAVVLSGDGGDELFGGYDRYLLFRRVQHFVSSSIGREVLRLHPRGRAWIRNLSALDEAGVFLSFHATAIRERQRLFGDAVQDEYILDEWRTKLSKGSIEDGVARFMALDRETWLRDDAFVRSDRLTMRHGLELRVPLTDDSVIDFATSVPSDYHVGHGKTKALWRDAFSDRCFSDVLQEKKRGWVPPTSKWLRAGLKEWSREILEDAIATQTWIHGPDLRKMWDEHQESKKYRLQELWTVIAYQVWWRENRNIIIDV